MRMTQAENTVSYPDRDGDWVVSGASEAACKEIQVRGLKQIDFPFCALHLSL